MPAIKPKAAANPDQPLRPHLINIKELAFVLGRSAESLSRDDKAGTIPASIKLGSSVRWDWNEILEWVKAKCPDRKTWEAREKGEPSGSESPRPPQAGTSQPAPKARRRRKAQAQSVGVQS